MPGARRARSLACKIKFKHTSVVTTVTPDSPGIPRAMVYGLYRALPGDRAFLPPSPRGVASTKLDASVGASGPHDFAVRGSKSFVADIARVHRIPHPTSVTIAQTPLLRGTGRARCAADLGSRSMPPSRGRLARRARNPLPQLRSSFGAGDGRGGVSSFSPCGKMELHVTD